MIDMQRALQSAQREAKQSMQAVREERVAAAEAAATATQMDALAAEKEAAVKQVAATLQELAVAQGEAARVAEESAALRQELDAALADKAAALERNAELEEQLAAAELTCAAAREKERDAGAVGEGGDGLSVQEKLRAAERALSRVHTDWQADKMRSAEVVAQQQRQLALLSSQLEQAMHRM